MKEHIGKANGSLVENGEINRELTKQEGAYFGIDPEILEFLNVLARESITRRDIGDTVTTNGRKNTHLLYSTNSTINTE